MLEYVYVCRHGFRANWIDPSIKSGPTGMPRDPPLAAYGLTQSVQLATFLTDPKALTPYPIPERVFSSPFYRCIQTAVPTWNALQGGGQGGKSERGQELRKGAENGGKGDEGIMLEHGVMEWYSPARPSTGLHPRPSSPSTLSPLFPPGSIDETYQSTLFPSRRGELIRELHDRADLFVEAWTGRVEVEMPEVKGVVVFGHAASVIALGRALTGDKYLEIPAGCASCSLYRRKRPSQATTDVQTPCGVGEWEPVWLGRADYLDNGLERNWALSDAVIVDGEVVGDEGDHSPHPPEDTIPVGLAPGMDRYLRRGLPVINTGIKEIEEAIEAEKKLSQGMGVGKGKM